MTQDEFMKVQFEALRREIDQTKERMHRTLGFGIVGIPAGSYLSNTYQIQPLVIALPVLVVVIALIYLSDNLAVMRCGRYIRLCVEPTVARDQSVMLWEQWLEQPHEFSPRAVDKHVNYGFYLLFLIYF